MRSSNRLGLEIVHGLINTSTNNEEDKVTFFMCLVLLVVITDRDMMTSDMVLWSWLLSFCLTWPMNIHVI